MGTVKILFLSSMSDFSGGEIVLKRLLENNTRINPVFAAPPGRFCDVLQNDQVKVHVVPSLISKGRISKLKYVLNIIHNLRILNKIISSEKPDILFANSLGVSFYSAVLGFFTRIPNLYVHHHPVMSKNGMMRKSATLLALLHKRVVAVSNAVKNSYPANSKVQKRIITIYNGLQMPPQEIEENMISDAHIFQIALVATITPWKGHHLVIEAAKHIKETRVDVYNRIHFLFVGEVLNQNPADTAYKETLEKQIQNENVNDKFEFTGKINQMSGLYKSVDIVLNCSIEPEPFGTTIYEAMAHKKIVVASNLGGTPEIIDDHVNGFLFEAGKANELANIIIEVMEKYDKLKNMRQKAMEKVLVSFGLDKMRLNYDKVFKSMNA